MGGFSIFHYIIVLAVLVIPIVVVLANKPSGRNRFGPGAAPMSFAGAVSQGLRKGADFQGRASRSEYWWFYLGYVVPMVVLFCVLANFGDFGPLFVVLQILLIPHLAVSARRLHDLNRSGWWGLLGIIGPGGIALLILMAQPSQRDEAPKVF